jgi:hypothetical protein
VLAVRALLALATACVAVLAGCRAKHECGTVVSDAPTSVTGDLSYRPGDGLSTFRGAASIWSMGTTTLTLKATLADEHGASRDVTISLTGLREGATLDLANDAHGDVCLVVQSGAPETCVPLGGTIEVKTLALDCFDHESGVSVCAENVDAALRATAADSGASMTIDLDVTEKQHWDDHGCSL